LIEQAPPTFSSFFIDEPKLVFGDGELCADPKTGISAFGPIASGLSKRVIRIGIIGTGKGIDSMRAYLDNARVRIELGLNSKGKLFDTFCFPDFPGIDKSSGLPSIRTREFSVRSHWITSRTLLIPATQRRGCGRSLL
jgi:hypothetical protein